MKGNLTLTVSVLINSSAKKVWTVLTDPDQVRKWLFGTHMKTDWKEESPITYEGEYEGKKYQDKGIVKKYLPEKELITSYWSSMSGKADLPENYNTVTYTLKKEGDGTRLTLIQDNINSEKEKEHLLQNWNMVLGKIKEVAESIS
jgi:uncharacterized protein YndB with AHSA1/START domain